MSKNLSKNKIRIVTAASLFDGHDASINIFRRIIQASGAEVIHLGHDRSAKEIVDCAIQEDVDAIAITSYQGGHIEFFKYIFDLLNQQNSGHIKIFGGGGGTILPSEIKELEKYGIEKIYHPDHGRAMGLQGMIDDMLSRITKFKVQGSKFKVTLPSLISLCENSPSEAKKELKKLKAKNIPVLGITGTGGAGKSTITDELLRRLLKQNPTKKFAVISIDPSKRKTGGALLGDRIRMNAVSNGRVYMRSLATRQANLSVSPFVKDALQVLKSSDFDLILLETSGIGQSDTEITQYADVSLYVMTPEFGAPSQLEKIDMLDFADLIALNKFDKKGGLDALRDIKKQYQRNHGLWKQQSEEMPVIGTVASRFNDEGINDLYSRIVALLNEKGAKFKTTAIVANQTEMAAVIPSSRVRYLSEISEEIRKYNAEVEKKAEVANQVYGFQKALEVLQNKDLQSKYEELKQQLSKENLQLLENWKKKKEAYKKSEFTYSVRGKDIKVPLYTESLSQNKIPKVVLPRFEAWGDILRWSLQENVPGEFPYTAGLFPFKRSGEDPTRMFAGEGSPERTNKRFHYVSADMPAKRLSTAFDSVTLYGRDPDHRPDIYGKVGNSGVSVCCLDDIKKLYSGFDLCSPNTSVSMTINGPAPIVLAFFLNAAIDQQCEKYMAVETQNFASVQKVKSQKVQYNGSLPKGNDGLGLKLLGITGDEVLSKEVYNKIKAETLRQVRGTVQADILKEDQAQNTCIFSTDFALKMMGDVQEYFIQNKIQNYYSVSVSGYHIAEAGANPVTQLAFTLANGFTYVEYYISRGMNINDFGGNLSFFFSNGLDPEYAVIGRVARRIWAKAMKLKYGANEKAQMLKYHIQTSGRSLHAQEIDFNDIRTTLQALYAIYDNCNSLHTNAYDEAITTPTEESVRRALAIQMIINKELGLAVNENPLQGSFIIEELTDLVEEAVMVEFDRLTERGGVLGAMETMYQRSKIQEESMYYEGLKHSGQFPIIGVNTFLSSKGSPTILPKEIIRAEKKEKENQIVTLNVLHKARKVAAEKAIEEVKQAVLKGANVFETLMEAAKVCSLGQLTEALFEVGGQYRRSM
ncbi:MAG: methylmalonyl-CoA mutase family protein [Bacteroidetes bacterium]|nr:methylmalonyl-CoA mutase family protein [Bacteroidota bacterium]